MKVAIEWLRKAIPKKPSRHRRSLLMLSATLVLAILILTGCSPAVQVSQIPSASVTDTGKTLESSSLYDEETVVSLYEQTIGAVVEVKTVVGSEGGAFDPFGFGVPQQRGQGSGFIIDREGHILTNNHVVDSASSVQVTLHDNTTLDAEVVGTDRENDLALLKIDPDKLGDIAPLPLGDSDNVKPGQMAVALGAPFGLEGSITVGVISGVGRSIPSVAQRPITNMLQTDAAINPGNSGGPLLNSKGEVIGVNTAIEAASSGIGFAIAINTAKSLLPALLQGGEVSSPWLGIRGTAVTEELATKLDLPVDGGVYVVAVVPGSPAEEAGLRGSGTDEQGQPTFGGDIITAVDQQAVVKVEDLVDYLNGKKPGDEVSLSVRRGDEDLTIVVTLREWPQEIPTPGQTPTPKEFHWGPFHWYWETP